MKLYPDHVGILKGLCGRREANCKGSREDGVAWNGGVVPQHRFQHYSYLSATAKTRKEVTFATLFLPLQEKEPVVKIFLFLSK